VNPDIDIVKTEVLSDNWYVLRKVHYRMRKPDGTWAARTREAYEGGACNGGLTFVDGILRRVEPSADATAP